MSSFLIIAFGQLVSLVGSRLTSFALGIWVYQRTGSITDLGLISTVAVLPNIAIAPIAGVIVDTCNRRLIMLLSDLAAGLATLVLVFLLFTRQLTTWEVYLFVSANSFATAFRLPSYIALLSQLVPVRHVGRASGMIQLGPAAAQIISPLLAAALIGIIGLHGVVLIDFITFLFAITTLWMIRVPAPPRVQSLPLLQQAAQGWQYIAVRPGLVRLLLFFTLFNVSSSSSDILLTPIILAFASTAVLGAIMSIGAIGFLAGTMLMSVWGGPRRRVAGLLACAFLYGIGLVLGGLRPSIPLVTVAVFLMLFELPLINGCNQAIWHSKTALELQGRVVATRIVMAWSSAPIAFFVAGHLAEHIFEPLLAAQGPLAGTWVSSIGIGRGRGAGLLLILNGILLLFVTIAASLNRRLRYLEDEVPSAMLA